MNERPGAQDRVGFTGLIVAEHFRDTEGQDLLLFIDNIFWVAILNDTRNYACVIVLLQS